MENPPLVHESLWEHGLSLERAGDRAGAWAAYNRATEAGVPPSGARATLRHAEVLELTGAPEAAEAEFRIAAETDELDVRAGALRGVASYLVARGAIHQALAALEAIAATGDTEEAPRALRNIGTFKEDSLGDRAGAKDAYEAAIATGHPLHSQGARVNLAQMLDGQGDRRRAAELFREVIASGHPVEAGRARVLLGLMLQENGDEAQALECLESAIGDPDAEWSQRGAFHAGAIYLTNRGQFDRAADAFGRAGGGPDPDMAAIAHFMRGDAERARENPQEALAAYLRAVEYDGLQGTARAAQFAAAKQAGVILIQRGDPGRAKPLLERAANAEDPEERARGTCLLGMCEQQLGDWLAAKAAFEAAIANPAAPEDIRELSYRSLREGRVN
jgi:tetratricopeptide (TPR) repeat protein